MRRSNINISTSVAVVILCIFFFMGLLIGIYSTANREMVSRKNSGGLPSTRALSRIYTSTLEYRLAEMEHVLSLKEEAMRDYEYRMKTVLKRLKHDQQTYETLIASQEERSLYERYLLDWQKYLKESQRSISLSKNNVKEQAVAVLREKTWVSYQEVNKRLDRLIESNLTYANSFSRFSKELLGEFRLTIYMLFIIGITVFLILIFNLFEKMKKRIK